MIQSQIVHTQISLEKYLTINLESRWKLKKIEIAVRG